MGISAGLGPDSLRAGMQLVATGTLSGTGTNFANCFTSSYTNYRIVLDSLQLSGTGDMYVQMLLGSTAQNSGGNYYWAYTGYTSAGAGANSNGAGQDLGYVGFTQSGANNLVIGSTSFDVYGPQIAQRTFMTMNSVGYTGTSFAARIGIVEHNLTTAYDGIRFLTNTAVTMGGNVSIYGYGK